jgi:hypothetical protein
MAASPVRSRSPASLLSLTWKCGDCLVRLPEQVRKQAAFLSGLVRMEPMLIGSVRRTLRCSTARTMEAAYGPTPHRGRPAPLARALRGSRAPRSFLEGIFPFQEDGSLFSEEPLPPCVTAPTIACPPSFTVTCSTRTVCSPPLRYRLSASTCQPQSGRVFTPPRSRKLPRQGTTPSAPKLRKSAVCACDSR